MRNSLAALALISTLSFAHSAAGATNGLDERFGSSGVVLLGPTPVSGITINRISALVIQDDNKIVIAGRSFDTVNFTDVPAIGRLDADGGWDTSFGDHGLFVLPYGTPSAPYGGDFGEVAVLSDKSVIAVGGAAYASGSGNEFKLCTLLAKVGATGTLSATFAPDQSGSFCYDFGADSFRYMHFEGLALDGSDTFYATTPANGLDHGAVAHFDSNGALITSYGNNGVADLPVGVFANLLQPVSDGLLAIGVSNGNAAIVVARLDASGSIVTAYGTNGVFTFNSQPSSCCAGPTQVMLDSQQRLLIADNDFDGGSYYPYRFARVTDAGEFDVTFNGSAQQPGYPGFAMPHVSDCNNVIDCDYLVALQPLPDGHLFAAGNAGYIAAGDGESDLALLRLNDDSSYDTTFGDAAHPGWSSINIYGTAASNAYARALATDTDGRVLVAISANDGAGHYCVGIVRVVGDRLFDGQFEISPAFPACP